MQLFLAEEGAPEWEQKVQKRLKVESQRGYMVDESASMVSSPIEVRQLEALNFRAVGIFTAAALGLGLALMLFISGFKIWAGAAALIVIAGLIFRTKRKTFKIMSWYSIALIGTYIIGAYILFTR